MRASPIRKLTTNNIGKDYVVGDLHGCFDLLNRLMEYVDFDESCDRLFSVGDLIDRGPDSIYCLGFLDESWFYAVQGNHELMMLEPFLNYLDSGKVEDFDRIKNSGLFDFGGEWIEEHYQSSTKTMSPEFTHYLKKVLDLPIMLVVGEDENRFHVIHAELVIPSHLNSKQIVWLDRDIDQWLEQQSIHKNIQDIIYWGRTLMTNTPTDLKNTKIQPGLSTTFCGHTYATKPRQVLSHLCLDTGGYLSLETEGDRSTRGYGLTLFDVQSSSCFSAAYGNATVIEGIRS